MAEDAHRLHDDGGGTALDPHAPGCLDLTPRALSSLEPMRVAVIERVDEDHDHADRLKSLGLCVGRKLQVIKTGDPLIVRVLGSRLGLSARLADRVYVTPCMNSGAASTAQATAASQPEATRPVQERGA